MFLVYMLAVNKKENDYLYSNIGYCTWGHGGHTHETGITPFTSMVSRMLKGCARTLEDMLCNLINK